MPDRIDQAMKLDLMRFACAFAWADLEVQPEERAYLLALMERLEIDKPGDRTRVMRWLKAPPNEDEIDPLAVPLASRETFLKECEEVIRADGVIHPEETEAYTLLKKIFFGERAKANLEGARPMSSDRKATIDQMNRILQLELAGVSRYLHYSFLVFGPNRIPIVSFFREQASEGIQHAVMVGEKITAYSGHPTIVVESPPEPEKHDVRSLLQESLDFERKGLQAYKDLLKMCGDDIALEELTRSQVRAETEHCEEVEKMLREVAK